MTEVTDSAPDPEQTPERRLGDHPDILGDDDTVVQEEAVTDDVNLLDPEVDSEDEPVVDDLHPANEDVLAEEVPDGVTE